MFSRTAASRVNTGDERTLVVEIKQNSGDDAVYLHMYDVGPYWDIEDNLRGGLSNNYR